MENTMNPLNNLFTKRCELCCVNVSGEVNYQMHLKGKKHRMKLKVFAGGSEPNRPKAPASNTLSKDVSLIRMEVPDLAPGEPVPPGLEDIICRVSQIQSELNMYNSSPLIGLEYLAETTVNDDPSTLEYFCLLCDKKGAKRIVISHLNSLQHQLKYLKMNFPSVHNNLKCLIAGPDTKKLVMKIINGVSARIEKEFGRMKPLVVEKQTLLEKKSYYFEKIKKERRLWDTSCFSDIIGKNLQHGTREQKKEGHKEEKIKKVSDVYPGVDGDGSSDDIQVIGVICKSKTNIDKGQAAEKIENVELSMQESMNVDIGVGNISRNEMWDLERKENSCLHRTASPAKLSSISSASPDRLSLKLSRSPSPTYRSNRKFQRNIVASESEKSFEQSSMQNFTSFRDRYQQITRKIRSRSKSQSRNRSRSRSKSRCSSPPKSRSRSPSRSRMKLKSDRISTCRSPSLLPKAFRQTNSNSKSALILNEPMSSCNKSSNRKRHGSKKSGVRHKRSKTLDERKVWEKYRAKADTLEMEMAENLQHYEKCPEEHPSYAIEWKKFYSRQVEENKGRRNFDTKCDDVKLEWIAYWGRKMHELHDQELHQRKDDIRKRLGLPEERDEPTPYICFDRKRKNSKKYLNETDDGWIPPAPVKLPERPLSPNIPNPPPLASGGKCVTVSDMKSTWKALTGSDIEYMCYKRGTVSELGNPQAELIPTLRLISALEEQLGSLGPQVNYHLSQALILQRRGESLDSIIRNNDIIALIETVKEKLSGQLDAGIVKRLLVSAVERTIHAITSFMKNISAYKISIQSDEMDSAVKCDKIFSPGNCGRSGLVAASERRDVVPVTVPSEHARNTTTSNITTTQVAGGVPVVVPGVGEVEKCALAEQIAIVLAKNGKTNVDETELQGLVQAVVGLAQAEGGPPFKLKNSDASTTKTPESFGNPTLNDSMSMVCNNVTEKDCSNAQLKPSSNSEQSKYCLIKVDLEENACRNSYRAHSLKSFPIAMEGSKFCEAQESLNAAHKKELFLHIPDWSRDEKCRNTNYSTSHQSQPPEEPEVMHHLHGRNEVVQKPELSVARGSADVSPFSLYDSNPVGEQVAPMTGIKKEFIEKPSWETDSSIPTHSGYMGDYYQMCDMEGKRKYNDDNPSCAFIRSDIHRHSKTENASIVMDAVISSFGEKYIDPRSGQLSQNRRTQSPGDNYETEPLKYGDPRVKVALCHQGQSQSPPLYPRIPVERSYGSSHSKPGINSHCYDALKFEDGASDYHSSNVPGHSFNQLPSERIHSHNYGQSSSSSYQSRQHSDFFHENTEYRYPMEEKKYSESIYNS